MDSNSIFAPLGQKEIEGELEAYKAMSAVEEQLKAVLKAVDLAFPTAWSTDGEEGLLALDRSGKKVLSWLEQVREELL